MDFWAKTQADGTPGLSIHQHGNNVQAVCAALYTALEAYGFFHACSKKLAEFLALTHDVGKISP